MYMDQITKEANPDTETLNEPLFDDDQVMISNDKEQLRPVHTDQLNTCCETYANQHQQDRSDDSQQNTRKA